ncbi:hypothetical protein MIDIC_110114 [Alphaproteobacteria bacterium]
MSFLLALQKQIFHLIFSDEIITKNVYGVYTHIPAAAKMPYIYVAETVLVSTRLSFCTRYDCDLILKVFFDSCSNKGCCEVLHRLKEILESSNIAIKGWTLSPTKVVQVSVEQSQNDLIWRGEMLAKLWCISESPDLSVIVK